MLTYLKVLKMFCIFLWGDAFLKKIYSSLIIFYFFCFSFGDIFSALNSNLILNSGSHKFKALAVPY